MKCRQNGAVCPGVVAVAAFFLSTIPPAFAANFNHTGKAVPPAVATGTCAATEESYSVSTDLQTTTSKSFTDVEGTPVSFTQGAAGCVEVSFSSEAATMPNEILVTQVVLDSGTVCTPGDNLFASDSPSGDPSVHEMNYICPTVAAGAHSVKVQFKSRYGSKVALDYRTTIVRYTP
jgi:hypothetical protein